MSDDVIKVLFAAGGLFAGVTLMFAGEQVKPAENVVKPALAPAPHSFCRAGWKANEIEAEHIVALTCEKNGVTVILNQDGSFNLAEQGGRFITRESDVPGWD